MRAQVVYPDRTMKKRGQEFQVVGFWSQADEVGLNQSHDPQRRHRIKFVPALGVNDSTLEQFRV